MVLCQHSSEWQVEAEETSISLSRMDCLSRRPTSIISVSMVSQCAPLSNKWRRNSFLWHQIWSFVTKSLWIPLNVCHSRLWYETLEAINLLNWFWKMTQSDEFTDRKCRCNRQSTYLSFTNSQLGWLCLHKISVAMPTEVCNVMTYNLIALVSIWSHFEG